MAMLGCTSNERATMELTADKLQPADSAFPTLVCANFDRASVMMGSKSGVATRIQQSFPWVIHIHCVAHKLELGILDGVKAVKYLFEAIVEDHLSVLPLFPKAKEGASRNCHNLGGRPSAVWFRATISYCWATRLISLVAHWATTCQSMLASPA